MSVSSYAWCKSGCFSAFLVLQFKLPLIYFLYPVTGLFPLTVAFLMILGEWSEQILINLIRQSSLNASLVFNYRRNMNSFL